MSRAALLAAALLFSGAPDRPPASIDFGGSQLGRAAFHALGFPVLHAHAAGVGFSAARTETGVVVVFEPQSAGPAAGTLTLRLRSGALRRVALRGRGVDTLRPTLTVETPDAVRAGRPATIRFIANDNDLVAHCLLTIGGRTVARVRWPATAFRWRPPAELRGPVRIAVTAVDRAGNRTTVTTGVLRVR